MTSTINIHEAKTNFSKLIERAMAGEDIVVARAGKPCVRLVPIDQTPLPPRTPGRLKALLGNLSREAVLAPCFTDDELEAIDDADILPPSA